MAITYTRTNSRQTTVLGVVVGLHALLGLTLVVGTAIDYVHELPRSITAIDIPLPARPVPKIPPPPAVPFTAPRVVLPTNDSVVIINAPPGGITVAPRGTADATSINRTDASVVTPIQMSAAGRQLLAESCSERYPAASIRQNEEGLVRILVFVSAEGRATDTRIEASSGFPRLDDATAACVKAAGKAFIPQKAGDRATGAWQSMSYRWKLT